MWGISPASSNCGCEWLRTPRSKAISHAQERKGMPLFARGLAHALQYVPSRDRAIRADVVGRALAHLAEHRPADLHRVVEVLGFHAPGAVVPGAALDGRDPGIGNL